jgi:hypothetical protein
LKANDPIVEAVETWHYGKYEGRDQAESIVCSAEIQGEPITIMKPESE